MIIFDPYSDASLVGRFGPDTGYAVNADGSGGTPADGVAAKWWGCTNSGWNASATNVYGTSGGMTYKTTGVAGSKPCLVGGTGFGLSLGKPSDLIALVDGSNPQFSVIIAFRATAYRQFGYLFQKSTGGNQDGSSRLVTGLISIGRAPGVEALTGVANMTRGGDIQLNKFQTMGYTADFSSGGLGISRSFANGYGFGSGGLPAVGTPDDVTIGCQPKASIITQNEFWGEIYEIFVFNRRLKPVEVRQADHAITANQSLPKSDASDSTTIVFNTNSILSITGANDLSPRAGGNGIHNNGWGGKTTETIRSLVEEDDIALLKYEKSVYPTRQTIYVINELSNSIVGLGSPEAAAESMWSVCRAVRPYADVLLASTLMERVNFSSESFVRANWCVRNHYTQWCDGIIDFAPTDLGVLGGSYSTAVAGDGVHPSGPWTTDQLRKVIGDALSPVMTPPTASVTEWRIAPPTDVPGNSRFVEGVTTGDFIIYPYRAFASGVTLDVTSSQAGDKVTSDDSSWTPSGNAGSLTWSSTGPGRFVGRAVRLKPCSFNGNRTLTFKQGATTVASMVISASGDPAASVTFAMSGPYTAATCPFASGVKSRLFRCYAFAGLASGSFTLTPVCSNGTVTLEAGSLTFDTTAAEFWWSVTPNTGETSCVVTWTNSAGGPVPSSTTYKCVVDTPALTIVAPPATAPRTTRYAASFAGTAKVTGKATSTAVGVSDSLARTVAPASTLNLTGQQFIAAFALSAGSPSGTHVLTATDGASLTGTANFVDNAAPYPSALGFTSINPTSFTVTTTAPTGGTSPYTYLFEYALEVTGKIPGTWTSIATASSATTATKTGLTSSARIFVRCTVTDAASLSTVGPVYEFLMSDLVAGVTSVTSITTSGAQATTTGGTNGYGTKTYQARIAPDVAGSPGTFTNVGSPGAPLTKALTGLTGSTAYWTQFGTTDSNPLAPGTVFDSAVTFTTSAGVVHVYPASVLIMGQ